MDPFSHTSSQVEDEQQVEREQRLLGYMQGEDKSLSRSRFPSGALPCLLFSCALTGSAIAGTQRVWGPQVCVCLNAFHDGLCFFTTLPV